jgi:hypothetical protein
MKRTHSPDPPTVKSSLFSLYYPSIPPANPPLRSLPRLEVHNSGLVFKDMDAKISMQVQQRSAPLRKCGCAIPTATITTYLTLYHHPRYIYYIYVPPPTLSPPRSLLQCRGASGLMNGRTIRHSPLFLWL